MFTEVFFTGFPGFIGGRLVKELMKEGAVVHCLVQPQAYSQAEQTRTDLCRELEVGEERIQLYPGDITREDLGLTPEVRAELTQKVSHVFHLAAVYDLAVPNALAEKVNVAGTEHINKLCLACPGLRGYIYYSTCYVSGTYTGRFREEDLELGQAFKNHYESTKHAAEVLVRSQMEQVPTIIIRPSIVVGDSQTGEIPKFDGPGFIMAFARKFRILPLPFVGTGSARFNLIPVDYLVAATMALAKNPEAYGCTFQVADSKPHLTRDVYAEIVRLITGKAPRWTMAEGPVVWLHRFGCARKLTGLELETFAYQTHHIEYCTANTEKFLAGSGVTCPDLMDFLPNLVNFFLEHFRDQDRYIPARQRIGGSK